MKTRFFITNENNPQNLDSRDFILQMKTWVEGLGVFTCKHKLTRIIIINIQKIIKKLGLIQVRSVTNESTGSLYFFMIIKRENNRRMTNKPANTPILWDDE